MQVLFDPSFDHCTPWPWAPDGSLPGTPKALLGHVFVGEEGFLSCLESLLGFAPPQATRLDRQLAYLQALQQANSADRFYRQSLAVDPLGTAMRLLEWRDSWLTLGWNKSNQTPSPPRLRDMLAVEFHCVTLAAGRGERLLRILKAIEKQSPEIIVITLRPPAQFQGLWARVLTQLKAQQRPLICDPQAKNPKSSLFHLQSYLAGKAQPQKLTQDESLQFVEAPSEMLLSFYTTNLIAPWFTSPEKPTSSAIVSWDQSETLALALMKQGLPRVFDAASHPRGEGADLLQYLLQLPWKPFDPALVYSFLEHPLNPLPHPLRRLLLKALSQQPGYEGPEWNEAMLEYEAGTTKTSPTSSTAKALIAQWLKPNQWDGQTTLAAVQDVCQQVMTWAQSNETLEPAAKESVQQNANSLRTLLNAWQALGHSHLSRLDLNKLIADSRVEPSQPILKAEASPLAALSHPGALMGPADRILLWGFHHTHRLKRSPWSASERLALSQQGVIWPEQRQEIRDDRALAIHAMMMAREQLLVTIPLQIAGEPCRQHPLMIELKRQFPKLPLRSVEQLLGDESAPGAAATHTEALEARPLPPIAKFWRLDPHLLEPRAKESPSSMENLIFKPYNYVLKYKAKLRTPKWRQVAQSTNLEGIVAHALIEHFFTVVWTKDFKLSTWQGKTPEQWIEDETLRLIGERAAILHHIERQSHRDLLIRTLKEALPILVREAQLSQVSEIKLETQVTASPWSPALKPPTSGGPLPKISGYLDLQWTNAQQQPCIIDVKWTRARQKYYRLLQSNQQIQLAVYCALVHAQHGRWAPSAYFVMPHPQLLAQEADSRAFAQARVPPARREGSTLELWQDIQKVWHWRWQALREGLVEVTTAEAKLRGGEDLPQEALGAIAIDLSEEQTEYDYKTLLGWAS